MIIKRGTFKDNFYNLLKGVRPVQFLAHHSLQQNGHQIPAEDLKKKIKKKRKSFSLKLNCEQVHLQI